jgi:hypothetical protein
VLLAGKSLIFTISTWLGFAARHIAYIAQLFLHIPDKTG